MPKDSRVTRDSDGVTVRLDKEEAEHADTTANAKRVVLVRPSGNLINSGRTFKYEDTSFVTGESPRTLDVNTDLGRNAVDGYFINDGDGNLLIEFSDDGTSYGEQHTIKKGEVVDLENLDIDSIRLTWVSNSAYRILVI